GRAGRSRAADIAPPFRDRLYPLRDQAERRCTAPRFRPRQVGMLPLPRVGGALSGALERSIAGTGSRVKRHVRMNARPQASAVAMQAVEAPFSGVPHPDQMRRCSAGYFSNCSLHAVNRAGDGSQTHDVQLGKRHEAKVGCAMLRVSVRILLDVVVVAVVLFVAAGTVEWPRAWLLLAVLLVVRMLSAILVFRFQPTLLLE